MAKKYTVDVNEKFYRDFDTEEEALEFAQSFPAPVYANGKWNRGAKFVEVSSYGSNFVFWSNF